MNSNNNELIPLLLYVALAGLFFIISDEFLSLQEKLRSKVLCLCREIDSKRCKILIIK